MGEVAYVTQDKRKIQVLEAFEDARWLRVGAPPFDEARSADHLRMATHEHLAARRIQDRILRVLAEKSPTVGFMWAMAKRSLGIGLISVL